MVKNYLKSIKFVLAVFIFLLTPVCFVYADELGDQVDFYVESEYDFEERDQIGATLRGKGNFIYFYIEDDYWQGLSHDERVEANSILEELINEFDTVIYPRERSVFGSEWKPGIDNDDRITALVTQLNSTAGGYFNSQDEFPKSQIDRSNEREMFYLSTSAFTSSENKSYLAHEFQHLINFYQKTVLHQKEEDVWLNEARSEYAPTVCGYNEDYSNSYLARRIDSFVEYPIDSITEWQKKIYDYGTITAFVHYLAGRYGDEIITRMVLNDKVGIESINEALFSFGYEETFSDVFADWVVANYVNDCQIGDNQSYCYNNNDLNYQHLHVDPLASYAGFSELIVSRTGTTKDWAGNWYRFRQHSDNDTKDTFKLRFEGNGNTADFKVPYIITEPGKETKVKFVELSDQEGVFYVPNFVSGNKTVIIAPFNQNKRTGFGENEPDVSFSFTASTIDLSEPIINRLSPSKGSAEGGFKVIVEGAYFEEVEELVFGGKEIEDFEIIDDNNIAFTAPIHEEGLVDIKLKIADNKYILENAFEYQEGNLDLPEYPEGSLLRTKNGYKVYVINEHGYKRWIQTAEIFNYYNHLKWEDIIEVDKEVLDKYKTSRLIRADGDEKVYRLNSDRTRNWLNMTAQEFIEGGRSWKAIFVINSWERDYYNIGAEIKS